MHDAPLKLGIIGNPLSHTRSPAMHNALLKRLALEGSYVSIPTPSEQLEATLQECLLSGYRGLNVTIPHKSAVIPFLTQLSPVAEQLGAVNTLIALPNQEGWMGENTDAPGFLASLPETVRQQLPQTHVLLLGLGGSARAVIWALAQAGLKSLTIAMRAPSKARSLNTWLKQTLPEDCRVSVCTLTSLHLLPQQLSEIGLVINTTPIGMASAGTASKQTPLSKEAFAYLPSNAWVIDLIYSPPETPLLALAKELDHPTQNGLEMLIQQGLLSFQHWSGLKQISESLIDTVRAAAQS